MEVRLPEGARKKRKRVGRGPGSGHGKTSCRGHKGQKQRTSTKKWFEGGQMPLQRRLPKRGFRNPFPTRYQIVNVSDLVRCQEAELIDSKVLEETGLIRSAKKPVKLLGDGRVSVAMTVRVDAATETAREKIQAAGGKVEIASAVVEGSL